MNTKYSILKIDMDWALPKEFLRDFILTRKILLESMGYSVKEIIYRKSGSMKGLHFWIYVEPKIKNDMEILKVQFLLNDCLTRCKINYKRLTTKRTILPWNIFYDKIIYKKEMPENCKRCALLRYMREK